MDIRLHGRGGQGVRFAAKILARALFLSGFQTQDFAIYGAERRGAPVTSFVRSDKKTILERGYIFEPDVVVLLDDTLNFSSVSGGLKGIMLINSHRKPEYFSKPSVVEQVSVNICFARNFSKKFSLNKKIYCIDATQTALQTIGKPIANAAIIGALARLMNIDLNALETAMQIEFEAERLGEVSQKNIEAAKKCYEAIK